MSICDADLIRTLFFEYSLYMTQQNLVAFSTFMPAIRLHMSQQEQMICVRYNIKVFIFVKCCNEGKHHTVSAVSDAVCSKGHKDFPFTGSLQEQL